MKALCCIILLGFYIILNDVLINRVSANELESIFTDKEVFKQKLGSNKTTCILIVDMIIGLGLTTRSTDGWVTEIKYLEPVQDSSIDFERYSDIDALFRYKKGTERIVQMCVIPTGEKLQDYIPRIQYYAVNAYIKKIPTLQEVVFLAIINDTLFNHTTDSKFVNVNFGDEKYSIYNGTTIDKDDLKKFSFTIIEVPKLYKTSMENLRNNAERMMYVCSRADLLDSKDRAKIFNECYKEIFSLRGTSDTALMPNIQDAVSCFYAMSLASDNSGIEKQVKIDVAKKALEAGISVDVIANITGFNVEDIKKL